MPRTHHLALLASLMLGGCVSQMPPVSGFFAGRPNQLDLEATGLLGDPGLSRIRDDSHYDCAPDSVGGQAVLRCSEAPGWHLYEDPQVRVGIGLATGERWRFGLDLSSWSVQGGWRGEHLGALGWLTPPGSFGTGIKLKGSLATGLTGGVALSQYASPWPWLSLGGFQYLGRIPHLETWRQEGTSALLWAYPEAGVGGWARFGTESQFALEGRTGRDLDAGTWRTSLTLAVGFGGGERQPPP